jgi:integrase
MAWAEKRGSTWRVRYQRDDGTLGSENGFTTKTAAAARAAEIDADQRRDTFVDPRAGQISLADWVAVWQEGLHAGAMTRATYESHLRTHILPRFGTVPLNGITRMAVKTWANQLRSCRAERTVVDVVRLLSMLLNEAVEEQLITINPCRRLRLGKRTAPERPTATAEQVLAIAARTTPAEYALIVTAAYTGMRWGELAGLRRPNLHLDTRTIHIDAETGALHELSGNLTLGPPKTPASVRDIALPDFVVDLLTDHLQRHDHEHVFTSPHGALLRRGGFRRRVWLPAVAGNPAKDNPPIHARLHFHDLRHTHKTWLIEDGVAEIAQAQRLGHAVEGVTGIYSHVTAPVIARLVHGLQRRWHTTSTQMADGQSAPGSSVVWVGRRTAGGHAEGLAWRLDEAAS